MNHEMPDERSRRWRLVLGKDQSQQEASDGKQGAEQAGNEPGSDTDAPSESQENQLSERDQALDEALDQLYGDGAGELGGDGDSAPDIARWLGDINRYFPTPVAHIMQQDALKKLNLRELLNQPEVIAQIEPDIALVSKLVALSKLMPSETKESARQVVQQLVDELKEKLEYPLLQALYGTLNRSIRVRRPRKQKEINWLETIRLNLKHYQPELQTIIPETLIGYGKERSSLHDIILCVDQSGSMAQSVVFASIFASVLAAVPAIHTELVLFDTAVVNMTEVLSDPVELLFGLQLKGGTNIERAITYCETLVTRPRDSVLVLISDLYEGSGNKQRLVQRAATLKEAGVRVVVLLALSDQGSPRFNRPLAEDLAAVGIPSFACTPAIFPELMSAVLSDADLQQWLSSLGIS